MAVHIPGVEPPQDSPLDDIRSGRLALRVVRRVAGDDGGLTIHVFDQADGVDGAPEVLRYDCFIKQPHYHVAWSAENRPFVPITSDQPFEWSLADLAGNLDARLIDAGVRPLDALTRSALGAALTQLRSRGAQLLDQN